MFSGNVQSKNLNVLLKIYIVKKKGKILLLYCIKVVDLIQYRPRKSYRRIAKEYHERESVSSVRLKLSLSPLGFRKNRHWVGQFPTRSGYFWLCFLIGLFD